ncbi:hypothetical protein BD779DRAFT_153775 [Infundibulicybe gibba]|nr:hypothetical protein BD779DRAFT_153775 [Infundibulicybe gibba]
MSNQHSSADTEFVALRRHVDYYLPGGDLYFLVEHDQYRVHRFFFERESAFFRGKLAAPAPPGGTRQGSSESSAIVLDSVRSADFAKFLWVFYNPKYSVYQATPEEWIAILDLAFRWAFPEVKSLAVRELEKLKLDVIDRIVAYHKYDVDRNLLVNDYAALCQREMPLTLPEGMRLGMETTLNVARARECARSQLVGANGLRSPTSIQVKDEELHSLVVDMFSIPAPDPLSPSAITDAQPRTQTQTGNSTFSLLFEQHQSRNSIASAQNGTKPTQEAADPKSQPSQKAQANPPQQSTAPPVPNKPPQATSSINANGTAPAANGNSVTSNGAASTTQPTQSNGQAGQDNKAPTANGNGPSTANGNGSAPNGTAGSTAAPDTTNPSDGADNKLLGDSTPLSGAGRGRGGTQGGRGRGGR